MMKEWPVACLSLIDGWILVIFQVHCRCGQEAYGLLRTRIYFARRQWGRALGCWAIGFSLPLASRRKCTSWLSFQALCVPTQGLYFSLVRRMGRRSRVTGLSLSFFLHTSLTFFSSAKLYITSMSQVMVRSIRPLALFCPRRPKSSPVYSFLFGIQLCTNKAHLALSLNVVALERQKRVEWLACLCHSLHLFFRL